MVKEGYKICLQCDTLKRIEDYYNQETDPFCKYCWDGTFGPKIIDKKCSLCNLSKLKDDYYGIYDSVCKLCWDASHLKPTHKECTLCNKVKSMPDEYNREIDFICRFCTNKRKNYPKCLKCNEIKHPNLFFEKEICKKCNTSRIIDNRKRCSHCKEYKPFIEFYGKKKLSDYCIPCHKKSVLKSNKKNIKRVKAYFKMTQKYPWAIYSRKKANAKQMRIPFTITKQEFLEWYEKQTLICHYCGLAEEDFSKTGDGFITNKSNLSLDRKDNLKGYDLSNLVLSCNRCNSIKGSFFTYEEMKIIGTRCVKNHWHQRGIKTHRQGFKTALGL